MKILNQLARIVAASAVLGSVANADIILSGNALFDAFRADGTTPLGDGQLVLVVVDRSGDGFSAGVNFGLTVGDDISSFVGNSDDVIIGRNLSETALAGRAIPGSASTLKGAGIDSGDPFGIFFFDGLGAGATTVTSGVTYGFQTSASWTLNADPSNTQFGSGSGTYPTFSNDISANLSVAVPEPTSFLLGGFLAILGGAFSRRRPKTSTFVQ